MKKQYLVIFLLQFFVVFGQQNCVETTTDNGKKISRCWGSPLTFPEVPGIQVRVLGPIAHGFDMIGADPNKKSYYWNIEVKGTTNVLFGYVAIAADGHKTNRAGVDEFGNDDFTVPFEIDDEVIAQQNRATQKGQITQAFTYSNSETINIKLVRRTSTYGSSNSTTVNPTQSTIKGQAQRQNQQAAYNAEYARLQQEANRINQENSNRRQQYLNAFNAGVSAHNSGNYAEAKTQFNNALNYARTPEERTKAQDYYNKSNKTSNNIQRINTVSTTVQETLTGIDAILKANKQKKRLKEEDEQKEKLYKERIAEEKRQEIQKNANILEDKWNNAKALANTETDNGYRQAIQLMVPESNRINGNALNTIGFWYDKINDFENAFIFFDKAANSNDATGMNNLGIYFEYGKGTEKNISKALSWYTKSCNNGFQNACTILEEKKSQFENEKLKKIYTNSSTLADIYFELEQYQDALISYENSLLEKNQDSTQIGTTCKKIAHLYYYEEYQMKNYENALDWYKTAFDYNNKDDSTSLIIGNMYEKGLGVEISYKKAINYYMIAAEHENIDAMEKVGEIYQSGGYGIEKNFNEAKDWYVRAAEQGSRMAMRNLSNIYKEGDKFLKKNRSESKKWDIKAKEKFNFTVSN